MPTIPEFNVAEGRRAAAAGELRPSEIGIESLSQGARNISRLTQERAAMARQAGQSWDTALKDIDRGLADVGTQVENFQGRQEVSAQIPKYAQLSSAVQDQYSQAIAAHANGDPDALNKFNDWLGEQTENFEGAATTRAGREMAQRMSLSLTDEYLRRQHTDIGAVAGAATIASFQGAVNQYAALVERDPASFGLVARQITHSADILASNHDLPPAAQEKLRGEMTQQAITHIAEQTYYNILHGNAVTGAPSNPEAAEQFRQANSALFSPEQHTVMGEKANAQARLTLEQQKFDDAEQRRVEKEGVTQAVNDITSQLFRPDGTIQYGPDLMVQLGRAAALPGAQTDKDAHDLVVSTYRLLHTIADEQTSGKADQDNPQVVADLQHRALLPQEDPNHLTYNQLYQAKFDHSISNATLGFLNGIIGKNAKSDLQTQMESKTIGNTLSSVQSYFGVTPGGEYGAGNTAYAKFLNWFTPALQRAQNATPPESPTDFVQRNVLSKFDDTGAKNSFLDSFKTPADQNAGSGLYVAPPANPYSVAPQNQAGVTVPIPGAPPSAAAPPGQDKSELGNLFHSLFPGSK